jgi:hypothetical protein
VSIIIYFYLNMAHVISQCIGGLNVYLYCNDIQNMYFSNVKMHYIFLAFSMHHNKYVVL